MQKPITGQSIWLNFRTVTGKFITSIEFGGVNVSAWLRQDFQPERLFNHVIVLILAAAIALLGGFQLSGKPLKAPAYTQPGPATVTQNVQPQAEVERPLTLSGVLVNQNRGILFPSAVPYTIIPDRTVKVDAITTYSIATGDTIFDIAARYGLTPETLLWSNPDIEANPDLLTVGQQLTILPVDGVYHQVGASDTVQGIADTFKVDPQAILTYSLNQLDPENPIIVPGQWLIVPGGVKPYVAKYVSVAPAPEGALAGTGAFQWPASGNISQDYWGGHRALDISAWEGAPIYAADSGYVTAAHWDNTGYGWMIVVDHGNGFQTLYAHLQAMYVGVGNEVTQGQQIAEMGSTGNSTGPHLHFETILNGAKRNPWGFLP